MASQDRTSGSKFLAAVLAHGSTTEFFRVPAEWYKDDERVIYDFIVDFHRRHNSLPSAATVQEVLGRGLPAIREPVSYYRERLQNRALFSALLDPASQLRDALVDNNMERASTAVDLLYQAKRITAHSEEVLTFGELYEQTMSAYYRAQNRPGVSGVATGWQFLDEMTGGLHAGDLIFWLGRPQMGKTTYWLRQVLGARQGGHSVLAVSMEMPLEQLMRRALALLLGIDANLMKKGMLSNETLQYIQEGVSTLMNDNRMHFVAGQMKKTTTQLRALIHEYQPDAVFIDGAYLMHPAVANKYANKRSDRAEAVVGELKEMAMVDRIPIVATSQFNRASGAKGKGGSLENAGYTDAISTDSSLVFAVKPGRPPREDITRVLELLKGRDGEHGEYLMHYQWSPLNLDRVLDDEGASSADTLNWTPE